LIGRDPVEWREEKKKDGRTEKSKAMWAIGNASLEKKGREGGKKDSPHRRAG